MIDHYLATYGTLGPGRSNHHQLADLGGTWRKGFVRGRLVDQGWGTAMGFPALELDANGETVEVELLWSELLATQWPRLDTFEGDGYRRVAVTVALETGPAEAWIYVAARP